MRRREEAGVVSALVAVQLALAALVCLVVMDAASVLLARARAQTAADAAALSAAAAQWPFTGAADDPATAADQTATANGARLDSCACPVRGAEAAVEVSVPTRVRLLGVAPARVSARARASLDVGGLFAPPR